MAETNLDILIKVKDQASAILKKVDGQIETLEKSFNDLGKGTGLKTLGTELEKAESSAKGFNAEITKSTTIFQKATTSLKNMGKAATTLANKLEDSRTQIQEVSSALNKIALVGVAGLTASAAAAITFEQGMINVSKTTNIAGDELKDLGDSLVALSLELPVSANELAKIATIAGQLGIQSKDEIEAFTKSIAEISIVTDLTAESAANGLARLANIFDIPIDQVGKLASVLNELENTTTATAPILVNFIQRISAAANSVGITAAETAGLSATLIDLGLKAELAGTAVSRILFEMSGDAQKFADLTNQSVESFREKLETDAVGAFTEVAKVIGTLSAEDAFAAFEDLGLSGTRLKAVFTLLSKNTTLLEKNVNAANKEFEEGNSLQKELAVFLKSTLNQLKLLGNSVFDVAKIFGDVLLPAINGAIKVFRAMLAVFIELPGPLQAVIVVITSIGVGLAVLAAAATAAVLALAPLGVAVGVLVTRFGALPFSIGGSTAALASFSTVANVATAATTRLFAVLARFALAGGIVTAVAAVTVGVTLLNQEMKEVSKSSEESRKKINEIVNNNTVRSFTTLAEEVENLADKDKEAVVALQEEARLRKVIVDEQIADLIRQIDATDGLIASFTGVSEEVDNIGRKETLKKLQEQSEALNEDLGLLKTAVKDAGTNLDDMAESGTEVNTALLQMSKSAQGFITDLQTINSFSFTQLQTQAQNQASIRKSLLETSESSIGQIADAEADATRRTLIIKENEVQERLALQRRRIEEETALIESSTLTEEARVQRLQALATSSIQAQISAAQDLATARLKSVTDTETQLGGLAEFAIQLRLGLESQLQSIDDQIRDIQLRGLTDSERNAKIATEIEKTQSDVRKAIRLGEFNEARELLDKLNTLASDQDVTPETTAGFQLESAEATGKRTIAILEEEKKLREEVARAEQAQASASAASSGATLIAQEASLTNIRTQIDSLEGLSADVNLNSNFDSQVDLIDKVSSSLSQLEGSAATVSIDVITSSPILEFLDGGVINIPVEGLNQLSTVATQFEQSTVAVLQEVQRTIDSISALATAPNLNAPGFAGGGGVRGPGTGKSDSILARLSDGEFVMPADIVKRFGMGFFERLRSGNLPRFAEGGAVGLAPVSVGREDTVNIRLQLGKNNFDLRSDRDTAQNMLKSFKNLESGLVGG